MYTHFTGRNAQIIAARVAKREREIEMMIAVVNDADQRGVRDDAHIIEQPPRNVYHQPWAPDYSPGMLPAWHPLYDRRQDPRHARHNGATARADQVQS